LRAATEKELLSLVPMAGAGPMHIHVAEQLKEVEDCLAWSGARPVEWLLDHAPVDRHWCLIHATHIVPAERDAMARAGAVAGLCPVTEANLGDGIFDAAGFAAADGAYGVGSDSNVLVGVAEELRQLEYSQRLRDRARNVMAAGEGGSTGRSLYAAALAGGSHALGLRTTGIVEGAPADLVSLDARHPALVARQGDAILDSLIFAARDRLVDCVWRGGCKLVEGGRHLRRDACLARFRTAMQRLLS
jgi:formiminoglutamate deiminase